MFVNKNKLTLVFILKSKLRTSVDVNKDHCSHVEEPICISHRRKFLPNHGLRLQAQTITGVGSSRTQSLFKNLAITFFFSPVVSSKLSILLPVTLCRGWWDCINANPVSHRKLGSHGRWSPWPDPETPSRLICSAPGINWPHIQGQMHCGLNISLSPPSEDTHSPAVRTVWSRRTALHSFDLKVSVKGHLSLFL